MSKKVSQQALTGALASQQLKTGNIYTRADLRDLFHITASSIKNGIFKPATFDSVWIFVTEHKTADRTQYNDILTEDVLHMEGQLKGGTDYLLKEHTERGLELLLFYRKKKYEHPGAGFTYEGRFLYQNHEGSRPTKFTLHRETGTTLAIAEIESELETQGAFDPTDVIDARKRTLSSIVRRQGQKSFRKRLLKAYEGQCAVTGCSIEALLEAAHIVPYQGAETNVVSNGLLLRADIHTLFDLGLLWVNPDSLLVELADGLKQSEYSALDQKPLSLPLASSDRPSAKALQSHLDSLL
ncbi:HNH endonuclease [Pseudomonas sp. NPDC089734]|uniref:HNH endonuclease n=1 Tax=Pseudomonas sp. NPDC089734 TaxID=3364469 RepID=UPI00382D480A